MAGIPDSLKGRSYTRVSDWSREELELALDLADELKQERLRRKELRVLPGRTIGMIFHKPSTRTRVPGGTAAGPSPAGAPWSMAIRHNDQ